MKTWIKRGLGIALTTALVLWFVRGDYWADIQMKVALLRWQDWAIAAAAFAASYAVRASRVYDEFRSLAGLRWSGILRLTLIHNASVNVLPFRSGEAAFPLLLHRWFGVPVARAVAALLWLRIQDALVVLALAAFAWPNLPLALRVAWLLAVLAVAIAVPMWARRHRVATTQATPIGIVQKLGAALAESTRSHLRSWLWTIANWAIKLATQAWLLGALLGASFVAGWAGAMGVELAAILPIQGVAGFGTYEAGGAALMRSHGIILQQGLQAAFALHLFVISCALVSGALALILPPPARPNE